LLARLQEEVPGTYPEKLLRILPRELKGMIDPYRFGSAGLALACSFVPAVQRYHYASHDELRPCSSTAYNYARRLKTLKGLTPYEFICRSWAAEPQRFSTNPHHQIPGLNIP
jgi:hypothetical protein